MGIRLRVQEPVASVAIDTIPRRRRCGYFDHNAAVPPSRDGLAEQAVTPDRFSLGPSYCPVEEVIVVHELFQRAIGSLNHRLMLALGVAARFTELVTSKFDRRSLSTCLHRCARSGLLPTLPSRRTIATMCCVESRRRTGEANCAGWSASRRSSSRTTCTAEMPLWQS